MKKIRFENLNSPENYHDVPNYDGRIAIKKFLDARYTIGIAGCSLSYIDKNECDDFEKNFVKTLHLRHAIESLNSSFDLLLQIPWIYYRAWSEFNTSGGLRDREHKNYKEIIRNTNDWVYLAEKECSMKKLLKFLDVTDNPLKNNIEDFKNEYIFNESKQFTVRTLCNKMKHNHVLEFNELNKPYNFNLHVEDKKVNLKEEGLKIDIKQEFYSKSNPESIVGVIRTKYCEDLEIDIEYVGSDLFRFIDCKNQGGNYNIIDVLSECLSYYDAIVDLFEEVYSQIHPNIMPSLSLTNTEYKQGQEIDLNRYFSIV